MLLALALLPLMPLAEANHYSAQANGGGRTDCWELEQGPEGGPADVDPSNSPLGARVTTGVGWVFVGLQPENCTPDALDFLFPTVFQALRPLGEPVLLP